MFVSLCWWSWALYFLSGTTAASYYVDALWFESLGYATVFWTRLSLQAATFGAFALLTFLVVYGVFRALKPHPMGQLIGATILVNRRPVTLPVEPVLKLMGLGVSLAIAAVIGTSMMGRWMTLGAVLERAAQGNDARPHFRSIARFLLVHPAGRPLISGWLLTLSVIACLDRRGVRCHHRRRPNLDRVAILRSAGQTLARLIDRPRSVLFDAGRACVFGTLRSSVPGRHRLHGCHLHGCPRHLGRHANCLRGAAHRRWHSRRCCGFRTAPALAIGNRCSCRRVLSNLVGAVRWYVSGFIVAPNQLVRERPFITHNIEMTRRAYALDRIETHPFPADTGIEAVEPAKNQTTLENIRLWDWRALQDTLRQIQEIRTYYDFRTSTSIDIRSEDRFAR